MADVKNAVQEYFKDNAMQFAMRRTLFDKLSVKPNTNYKGTTADEVFFQKRTGAEVEFELVRHMEFEPEGVFEITVSFTFKRALNDSYANVDIDFTEWLKTLSQQELTALCGNIFSSITLVIAQLTNIGHGIPLITPPVFCQVKR